jgi:DNA processing protein
LITVKYAAAQGKEVFAPPAPINSPMSEAPNLLLKQGAKIITSIDDVLEEYKVTVKPAGVADIRNRLSAEEKPVFDCLMKEAFTVDELAILLKINVGDTMNALSLMEIKGVVSKMSDGKFRVIAGA